MRDLTKPLIAIGAAIVIGGAIVIYSFFFYSKPVLKATTTAEVMNLTQTVSAPGTVTASQNLTLAFQRGGQVVSIVGDVGTSVTTGQAVASVSSSDLDAQLEEAEAGLLTQQIKLDALQASTTSQTGSDVEVGINNAETTLLTTLVNDYQSLDGTLATNVDNLFDNARTNPLFEVSERGERRDISHKRELKSDPGLTA
jgi:multidrug efflux pump subunit AcrA (membrane-fusion protein)